MPLQTIAIVPASNEAERLPDTIEAMPEVSRLLIVDDGSRDDTAVVAGSLGAEVLTGGKSGSPLGKGGALLAGISHARQYGPDAVLLADADLGPTAAELRALIEALENGNQAAIAAFPPTTGGGFGLVKRYASSEISHRTGFTPKEPLSGQRALLIPAIESLPGIAPGFGAEVGMTLDLLQAGLEPVEIPLPLSHRTTGRTVPGFLHRARQGRDILKALKGERLPWP